MTGQRVGFWIITFNHPISLFYLIHQVPRSHTRRWSPRFTKLLCLTRRIFLDRILRRTKLGLPDTHARWSWWRTWSRSHPLFRRFTSIRIWLRTTVNNRIGFLRGAAKPAGEIGWIARVPTFTPHTGPYSSPDYFPDHVD